MRAYQVKAILEDGTDAVRFAGSHGDASKARMALVEMHGVKKMSVTIDEGEIPTDKAGLLAFLNTLMGA